ncbi:hypothetical protein JCM10212_007104 [Sporobolomyces blumeae]
MASTPAPASPELDATLSRLTSYKNVRGVLILSRPNGLIIRSAGSLFAFSPSTASDATTSARSMELNDQADGEHESEKKDGVVTTSELARRYARAAVRMVEAVGTDVHGLDEDVHDDLRFLRIRTKRHELMITPHEQYLLVVVQDPTN